jgi:hypothetical protein
LKRRNQVTFFIDRSLGRHSIASVLRKAGAAVEIHDDHFPPDALDSEWLPQVGIRRWAVLTKDKNFQYRSLEIRAIAASNVRVFQLSGGSLRAEQMAEIFERALNKMVRFAMSNPAPFIAKISPSGKIALAFRATQLRRYRS